MDFPKKGVHWLNIQHLEVMKGKYIGSMAEETLAQVLKHTTKFRGNQLRYTAHLYDTLNIYINVTKIH